MTNRFSVLLGTSAVVAGLICFSATEAKAAFIAATCSASNMTGADDCGGGYSGNDTGAGGTAISNLNTGIFDNLTGWKLADKSDTGATLPGFTINAEEDETTGNWNVTLPGSYTGPFAISLKAANFYSLYYFEDKTTLAGAFNTIGVAIDDKDPTKSPELSHASLFVVEGGTAIPEPLTMLGAGAAAGFGAFFKKRLAKSNKKDI